jgi:putative nucleotidyltransferase with HDIG domain
MKASEMIAKARNLPTISPAALELVGLLGRPDTNNEDLVHVLKQDSVLTAKLLRVCNSPSLKLGQPVASVDQAVLILGHQQISQMVMAMSLRGPLAIPLPAYELEANDLWLHSLMAAEAAEIAVADGLDVGVDSATAFTIGLLHDIGKLITSQFHTRQTLIGIYRQLDEGRSAIEAEREVLGTDHAEVGAALTYMWRLPNLIVEAIALHHSPITQPQPRPCALAWFADTVAHRAIATQANQDKSVLPSDAETFQALGFGGEELDSLLHKVCEFSAGRDEVLIAA